MPFALTEEKGVGGEGKEGTEGGRQEGINLTRNMQEIYKEDFQKTKTLLRDNF